MSSRRSSDLHVITSFPKSAYADYAFFRLGQYFYFKGQYSVARRYFSRVFRNYPESDLKDDSQYLYCQSIIAQGKVDSARLFLKAFVQNTKRSPFVDAAILDLESLGGLPQTSLIQSAPASTNISFAIQVASYKSFDDAKSALHKLSRVFPHVQVGQKTLGNTTYYHLLVGRFDSKAKATEYAKLYIKPHLSEYKVVELNL